MTAPRRRPQRSKRARAPGADMGMGNMNYAMKGMMDMSTMAVGATLMGGMIGVASNALPKP